MKTKNILIIFLNLVICVVFTAVSSRVIALSPEQKRIYQKGINYYDIGVACSNIGSSDSGGLGGGTQGESVLEGHSLPATIGGVGLEEAITPEGNLVGKSEKVTFSHLANKGQEYRDYYITMRWNYVKWNWNGTTTDVDNEELNWFSAKPRLVKVTNSQNNKTIIAAALESGPAPWTGVDNGSNNDPKQGWANPQSGTPNEYKGRVSGLPPKAFEALGLSSGDQRYQDKGPDLVYSWAEDQNATPGPLDGQSANPSSSTIVSGNNSNSSCACSGGSGQSTSLSGSDNAEKIWRYFASKGLDPVQIAGIMGNMSRESSFDPENIQNPGGRTKDPSSISGGWGLIQWTPGSKVISVAKEAGITTPIYELATQLDIVWWHMNNTSPTGASKMIENFKPNSVQESVEYFEKTIEGAGIKAITDRVAAAELIKKKYEKSSGDTITTKTSSNGSSCQTSSDYQNVNAEGYALPVKKEGVNLPCKQTTCHHDGTPAADLGITPDWEGTPVFAIIDGEIFNYKYRAGFGKGSAPELCKQFQLKGSDGWNYWYGHIMNVTVSNGSKVKAGQKIAEIGPSECADDTPPHLHIDRGSPKGSVGGMKCCRDPGFIPLLNKIFESTP